MTHLWGGGSPSLDHMTDTPNDTPDYTGILQGIEREIGPFRALGDIATGIPELRKVDPSRFGIHLLTMDGMDHAIGDSGERFSIQSVSKVFSLALAVSFVGEDLWERVGVEPSGNAFNSLT